MNKILLILIGFFPFLNCPTDFNRADLLDWQGLKNPVYQHEGWSVKDACMEYLNGEFYLFFSAFYFDDGRERSHVVSVKTKDFKTYSDPLFIWDGKDDGWIGMCSPNICKIKDHYILTYNSWGDKHANGFPNQLFYAVSTDLENWDNHKPLARNITVNEDGEPRRAIDAAINYFNDKYYLVWKAKQTPQVAVSSSLDSENWKVIGRPTENWFENGEFIQISNKWYLLGTVRGPEPERDHLPALSPMKANGDKDEHWIQWDDFKIMDIPLENFNTDGRANAGFLIDWRQYDGYFYLLYAGRTEHESHAGRGDNKLALARSKDLKSWQVP